MIYHLTICHQGEGGYIALKITLEATLEVTAEGTKITHASIDHTPTGQLTTHGLNSFRHLALAEAILAHALSLKPIDPQQEINALKAQVKTLQTQLTACQEETNLKS